MGFTEILTAVFVVLKLLGITQVAEWSWVKCLMPEIIAISFYLIVVIGSLIFQGSTIRKLK